MQKKYGIVALVGLLCALAIIAALWRNMETYKRQAAELTKAMQTQQAAMDAQKTALTELSSQCDKIKNTPPPECPPPPQAAQSEVESVLSPAAEGSDNQARIDDLKKRYEEILVTYFVLQKCEKVKETDYHVITSGLSQEMASLNAPGRLQYDILTSAQGSYRELYTNSPCDDATTAPLLVQYAAFIDALTKFKPQ